MTNTPNRKTVEQQARFWVVRIESGNATAEDQARFQAWQAEHPAHVQAYSYLAALNTVAGECAAATVSSSAAGTAVTDKTASTASTASTADIYGTVGAATTATAASRLRSRSRSRSWPTWRIAGMAIAAGLVAVAVILINNPLFQTAPDSVLFVTKIGELRQVVLEDNSTAHLSGATRIEVSYTPQARNITLLTGEAVFSVAHDAHRPFIVHANGTKVRAVGTEFDVHKQATGLVVSVIEGVVSVARVSRESPAEPERTVIIEKGQRITYDKGALKGEISHAPPEKFAAWRHGVLEFDQVALESVVADINRYAKGKITITDDSIRHLPVTAVFAAGDFEAVADVLPHILPVKAVVVSPQQIALTRRH